MFGLLNPIGAVHSIEQLLWGSTTRRGRGRSWRQRCPGPGPSQWARARRARPGSPSWNAGGDGPAWSRKRQPYEAPEPDATQPLHAAGLATSPTPSCTATPTSRSSTAPRTPRSSPRRPPGSAWRRWRSPTTTASTAWSASPRRPGPSACRRCSAPSSRSPTSRRTAPARARRSSSRHRHAPTPRADPHGDHLLVLADGPTGYARLARALSLGHLAGEKGAPQFTLADVAAAPPATVGAHRLPQGRGAGGAGRRRPGRRPRELRPAGRARSGATACWSSCGTTATRSTAPATTRWPRSPHGRRRVRRHQQRALRRPAQRRLATALAAVRARRSLDELDRWLPGRRRRPPARGGRAGAPVRPLPRRRSSGPPRSAGRARSTSRSSPRTCRRSRARRRRRDRDAVPAPARRAGGAPALRRPVRHADADQCSRRA